MYVKNSTASHLLDVKKEIDEAIGRMEAYINNDVLNPEKVEFASANMQEPDYSKVYGVYLGILYYDDGNIRHVGEVSNGQVNGFWFCWYPAGDGGRLCCQGIFENGMFVSGDDCFDREGNRIAIHELEEVMFTGDFEMIQGISDTRSSRAVAQQNANYEERDKLEAQLAVRDYLDTVIEKQSSITNITWINIPKVSGNYYFFSCIVEYGELEREGTVTVRKTSDGTFEVTGLEFDD